MSAHVGRGRKVSEVMPPAKVDWCAVRGSPGCEDRTRAQCFACGENACLSCTARIQWYAYGRRRVCVDCMEDHHRGTARWPRLRRVVARIRGWPYHPEEGVR